MARPFHVSKVSILRHILVLVRDAIAAFEAKHGPIEGDIRPDENVKPTRK